MKTRIDLEEGLKYALSGATDHVNPGDEKDTYKRDLIKSWCGSQVGSLGP